MNPAEILRRGVSLLPAGQGLAVVLSPAPGYEPQEYLAATVCLTIFVASLLMGSDGLHIISFSGLAILLVLAVSQIGILYALAVVVVLLVALDLVGLVESLLGLTWRRMDQQDKVTSSRYLDIIKKQAARSSMVGFTTFLLSVAIVTTPIPLISFGNPVTGSGILALAVLLLILLASSRPGKPRRIFRRSEARPSTE
jgi:hypothetical protein